MARKIRLTERNLQKLVKKVIKEAQLLNEADLDVLCKCKKKPECTCWGTFNGSEMLCGCCATECKDEPTGDKFGGGGRPMAQMDRMRESYQRGFKAGRNRRR
jgi:hypothetical protein